MTKSVTKTANHPKRAIPELLHVLDGGFFMYGWARSLGLRGRPRWLRLGQRSG